ncbi:hypothetical protein A2791_00585 [Candidatus Saccharibacteria bacterium RIFCSPHIGHO2_01_FULL_46_30]|nr:MAG: hypothetical protein A2791_00585 [Candidatus Saccharibacteria bacterium RIFCSPHIGHO2_01_FULL_46_30]
MRSVCRVNDAPHTLPPPELRAPEFRNLKSAQFTRIETPLSPLGLVDKTQLLKAVNETLIAEYKWPSTLDDDHHLQWPSNQYPNISNTRINPHSFRNNVGNRCDLPRNFHNWLHAVTQPPTLPSEEVMYYSNEAQIAIDTLHRCVQNAKMLVRKPNMKSGRLNDRLTELFYEYHEALAMLEGIPIEFHPIDVDDFRPKGIEDILNIQGQLGRLATSSTVAVATRIIRQPRAQTTIAA